MCIFFSLKLQLKREEERVIAKCSTWGALLIETINLVPQIGCDVNGARGSKLHCCEGARVGIYIFYIFSTFHKGRERKLSG